jgi:PPOX class probable F420-dependent enzyme
MTALSAQHLDLLRGENFGVIATVGEDGRVQTSVVWVDTDGENVLVNTTNWRAKGRNLRANPRVSISVWDNDDPYKYFEVEGPVELTEEGANEHILPHARRPRDRADQAAARARSRHLHWLNSCMTNMLGQCP